MKTRVPEKQERVGSNDARKEYATQSFHCKYQKVKGQLDFTETPNQDFALGAIELQLHPIAPEITYTSPSFAYVCVYDIYMHDHMYVDTHECICMWKSKTDIRVFFNHFLPYSLGAGSLNEPRTCQYRLSRLFQGCHLHLLSPAIAGEPLYLSSVFTSSEGLNSSPQAHTASTLLTETSPQL